MRVSKSTLVPLRRGEDTEIKTRREGSERQIRFCAALVLLSDHLSWKRDETLILLLHQELWSGSSGGHGKDEKICGTEKQRGFIGSRLHKKFWILN